MTQPQPAPQVQYVYVQRPPGTVIGPFAWITAILALLCVPVWYSHLGIVPIVAFLLSLGLTIGARSANPRSVHWKVAAALLVLALALNVLAAIAIS